MSLNYNNYRFPPTKNNLFSPTEISHFRSTELDHDSGLVYDQVEVRGPYGLEMSWISNYKHAHIAKLRLLPNSGTGARSLLQMALIKASNLSQDLTVEALRALPYSLGQLVWERIVEDHLESYQAWRVFATAYGSEFAIPQNRYMLDIKTPVLDHATYYKGLDSRITSWVTCLRISPKGTRVSDLVALSTITNLGVLDLSDGQLYMETRETTFDQRVLRSWSELARDRRAFQHLRVLMLGWQEKVGGWIFDYLDYFPNLNLFVTTACSFIDHKNHRDWEQQAWSRGWEFLPSKRGVKHLRKLLTDPTFYAANISSLYYESIRLSEGEDQMQQRTSEHPLLECWLGSPRAWSHIVEDFPGTKSVIFQKRRLVVSAASSYQTVEDPFKAIRTPSGTDSSTPLSTSSPESRNHKRRKPKHSAADLLAQMS